jgi:hypothetical protein
LNRLVAALAAYAIIAVLAWTTLSDEKLKFGALFEASPRMFVLAIMAVLAVLTLLNHWKRKAQEKLDDDRTI